MFFDRSHFFLCLWCYNRCFGGVAWAQEHPVSSEEDNQYQYHDDTPKDAVDILFLRICLCCLYHRFRFGNDWFFFHNRCYHNLLFCNRSFHSHDLFFSFFGDWFFCCCRFFCYFRGCFFDGSFFFNNCWFFFNNYRCFFNHNRSFFGYHRSFCYHYRCFFHSFRSIDNFFFGWCVFQFHAIVQDNRFKVSERLVDQVLHGGIRCEGHFGVSLDFKAFASVYIHTFAGIHFCQLESTEAFDLDILFIGQGFFYQVEHGLDKELGILFGHVVLGTKQVDYILQGYLFIHRDSWIGCLNFSFSALLGL